VNRPKPLGWHRVRRRLYLTRRFVIIRKTLKCSPVSDHLGEVIFRRARPADLERLDALDAHGRGSTQQAYVNDSQDLLFVACHDDRIVATRRCSLEIRDPLVARAVTLGEAQIWVADIFCLPEYRSQGVGRHLILFADRELASLRYSEVLAAVDAGNVASLRASLRSGSALSSYVTYVRFLFYERLRIYNEVPMQLQARLTRGA
jgi:GNAT superfamily N-acetyltransferase